MKSQNALGCLLDLALASQSFALPLFSTLQLARLALRQVADAPLASSSGSDDSATTVTTDQNTGASAPSTGQGVALDEGQGFAW